jgi:hypothetical protein
MHVLVRYGCIQDGMTEQEVAKVMGRPGDEVVYWGAVGGVPFPCRGWKAEGMCVACAFYEGRVVEKGMWDDEDWPMGDLWLASELYRRFGYSQPAGFATQR